MRVLRQKLVHTQQFPMFVLPQFDYSLEGLQDLGGGVVVSLQFVASEPLVGQVLTEVRHFLVGI